MVRGLPFLFFGPSPYRIVGADHDPPACTRRRRYIALQVYRAVGDGLARPAYERDSDIVSRRIHIPPKKHKKGKKTMNTD